jgi:hypothetical protein
MDPTAPEQCVLLNQVFWLVFDHNLSWWRPWSTAQYLYQDDLLLNDEACSVLCTCLLIEQWNTVV